MRSSEIPANRTCWFPAPSSTRSRDLPEETLVFLLGSRYCETDLLSEAAWQLFCQHAAGMAARAGDLRLRP